MEHHRHQHTSACTAVQQGVQDRGGDDEQDVQPVRHLPPGGLVDVGGYQLHVLCMGEGSPTVLLDAWAGGWSAEWEPLQPRLAR